LHVGVNIEGALGNTKQVHAGKVDDTKSDDGNRIKQRNTTYTLPQDVTHDQHVCGLS